MTHDLDSAIALGYEHRDRANLQPTIDYFRAVLRGDAKVLRSR